MFDEFSWTTFAAAFLIDMVRSVVIMVSVNYLLPDSVSMACFGISEIGIIHSYCLVVFLWAVGFSWRAQ